MNEPLVSVVLSSFNRPTLIRDAIESVLAQTWPNVECIIADDWSRDDVHEVIASYHEAFKAKGWRCITVVPKGPPTDHERQFGQRCAIGINEGMRHIKGEFVAFLCDDDMLLPHSIEVRATQLVDHAYMNVVYGKLRACISDIPVPGIHTEATPNCRHDDRCYWEPEPIKRAANRLDHGQFLVRNRATLPQWPEGTFRAGGEDFTCDDATFLWSLEQHGFGPFWPVDAVVIQKRYHSFAHLKAPARRE